MAVYKVPQDVEADDKLIGPFSFRQFIYLIIVVLAIMLAWGLSQLFIPLAIIPLPIIIFFGAIALPLRKDQPMEIYMAAIVSFYLKPRQRRWDADGIESLIEITAPKTVEVKRTKDLSQSEAQRRFSYLAQIVDTQGWAVRGVDAPANTPMNNDFFYEAQQTEDILDENNSMSQALTSRLDESDAKRRQEISDIMQHKVVPPSRPVVTPTRSAPVAERSAPAPAPIDEANLEFNPYPDINQTVIQPLSEKKKSVKSKPVEPIEKPLPAAIINLANNADLSIETIAHEANRIHEKEDEKEVIISLR